MRAWLFSGSVRVVQEVGAVTNKGMVIGAGISLAIIAALLIISGHTFIGLGAYAASFILCRWFI